MSGKPIEHFSLKNQLARVQYLIPQKNKNPFAGNLGQKALPSSGRILFSSDVNFSLENTLVINNSAI